MRATTDHHHGRTCDHHHGGTAIIDIRAYDDGRIDDVRQHHSLNPAHVRSLTGDDRRAALERVRAAINAELGDVPAGELPAGRRVPSDGDDAGQPDPAAVLAAVCRWITGFISPDGPDWQLIRATARHRPDD